MVLCRVLAVLRWLGLTAFLSWFTISALLTFLVHP